MVGDIGFILEVAEKSHSIHYRPSTLCKQSLPMTWSGKHLSPFIAIEETTSRPLWRVIYSRVLRGKR